MQQTQIWSLDWEDPLEKEMTTHSSILAWRIPWTEEPGRLQSMGSQSQHDWATNTHTHTHTHILTIHSYLSSVQFSCSVMSDSLQLHSWIAAGQASLSTTNSQSLLKLMSIELVMHFNHFILYCPLLLLPSIFPSSRVFSNELVLCIRWPKYGSFSISPSNEYSGLISLRMDWLDLLSVQGTLRVFSNTTVQKHQFFSAQLSL